LLTKKLIRMKFANNNLAAMELRDTSILRRKMNIGPILIINVYMPTNYGDDNSLELYMDCLSKLNATVS